MFRTIVIVAILALPLPAGLGQPQSDALATCLADNTSGRDRKDLARWVFLAMAAHPEMKEYSTAHASTALDESARNIAALVTRLLTDSCAKEAKAAIQEGGSPRQSFVLAFESLGRLAMQELMTDKSVTQTMGLFEHYIDQKRFEQMLGGE